MNKFIFTNQDIRIPRGHSIECRVYAENSYQGGVPSMGILGRVEWPEGPRRRFEFGFESGDTITSFYDPMIAKVIVWDETRPRAIEKMIHVLNQSVVFGVHTNIPYLIEILSHPEFISGVMTTQFIETYFPEALKSKHNEALRLENSKKIYKEFIQKKSNSSKSNFDQSNSAVPPSPWQSYWRNV